MFAARKTDNVSSAANYIEECFSVYLYTGNGSTQTITNGIDLSAKGGLVWCKSRASAYDHALYDTVRGINKELYSNATSAQYTGANTLTAFNSNGFTLGANSSANSDSSVSWTFRKQAKFFDVVTYTGDGSNRTIAHNLGSVPGCIIIKRTDTAADWQVYHRSLANTEYLVLNATDAKATGTTRWNSTTPTSTEFSLGTDSTVNANSGTYVAYLFAHDAGGFGAAGSDNVISCGSLSSDGSGNASVTLNYEPQWILVKKTSNTGGWLLIDNMRGWANSTSGDPYLLANSSAAEDATYDLGNPTATGFTLANLEASQTFIYIAIRRGPMKTPTSGTSVFSPVAQNGGGTVTTNFPVDLTFAKNRTTTSEWLDVDRLRGSSLYLDTTATLAEQNGGAAVFGNDKNTSIADNWFGGTSPIVYLNFQRSPSVFDVVCYTGTGSNTTFTHNLSVVPEMMIVKRRDSAAAWQVYANALANTEYLVLNTTAAKATGATRWNSTTPTSTVFSIGTDTTVNASGGTYVAYLFATVGGVSKVGSYTGNGSSQTINCGFAAGARFVMIKRTDSTGDWYVFNSARGIVSGNDPFMLLNSTAAEVTTRDAVDPDNSGFIVNNDATNFPINENTASYIFLAIS